MTAYSQITDLLIGDVRIDSILNPQAFVDSAADEIDAAIGSLYVTPIQITDTPTNRPTLLLLKLINNYLATGKLLLTISESGENNEINALGKYYINLAQQRITQIVQGQIELTGATRNEEAVGPSFQGPTIVNAEPESLVDMFYGNFNPSNSTYWFPNQPRPGVTF